MKIGYQGSKSGLKIADYIFSNYHEKILDPKQPLTLINTKNLCNGLLYPVDIMCTRTYYSKKQKHQPLNHYYRVGPRFTPPLDKTRHRFFECRECTAYRIYQDLVEDGEYSPIKVIKTPDIKIFGRLMGSTLLLDSFTRGVIISQYFWAKEVPGIISPVNVFVCGSTGYRYYSTTKEPTRKIKLEEIVNLYTPLMSYHFSFNDIPIIRINDKSELKITVPNNSNITIEGVRLVDYKETQSFYPKPIIIYEDNYFVVKTKKPAQIEKLKKMISHGELSIKAQISLNVVFSVCNLLNYYGGSQDTWNNLFIGFKSKKQNDWVTYNQMLFQLNDLKIKYVI